MENTKMVTARIAGEDYAAFAALCKSYDVTMSQAVRAFVRRALAVNSPQVDFSPLLDGKSGVGQ